MSELIADVSQFAKRLDAAWSIETSSLWSIDNAARGQCGVTSLVVQDLFGGHILKTSLPEGLHFYNFIAGHRFDLTACQFTHALDYQDTPSSREEAMSDTSPAQYRALRSGLGLPVKD
ncbi:hypothetical protein J2045_001701 [Peteryoungia aggregata LMG 23059]|uniref:Uncharacterized protein n=1 Tax=Peteryoungia aggregata LMG 23059 TaxID=1368425 RepID=A0ABU0G5Q2_9HYPH|nr:hypothetical protein [Peteryoungia aggregata]MDQ0420677.1 hypothetical protein [Peteryoungia aggregata LMG 23059]